MKKQLKKLGSLPTNLLTCKCRTAFTLAEVLITLGIIGVVAAMTLPTLIQKYQKQAYAVSAQKAVNTLSNMFEKIQADDDVTLLKDTNLVSSGQCNIYYGECEDRYGNPTVLETIVPKYLNVVKSCKGSECDVLTIKNSIVMDCYDRSTNKYDKNNCTFSTSNQVTNFGQTVDYSQEVRFYTNDGVRYSFSWGQNYLAVNFDTNGLKGPNIYGRDVFDITYCLSDKRTELLYTTVSPYMCDTPSENTYSFLSYLSENGWKMDY